MFVNFFPAEEITKNSDLTWWISIEQNVIRLVPTNDAMGSSTVGTLDNNDKLRVWSELFIIEKYDVD